MESFFQAAACALDKVLDDFERTEDDGDYFGLTPAARGSEMFSSRDGAQRAGVAAPEPALRPPPAATDNAPEKRSPLPALISPVPLSDGQDGERGRPFPGLPSIFVGEKPESPPSRSFSSASSASSVESPLPSPSFPVRPSTPPTAPSPPEKLLSSSPLPSLGTSPWVSVPADDAHNIAPIDPLAMRCGSDLADPDKEILLPPPSGGASNVTLISSALTLSDETVTPSPSPSPPRSLHSHPLQQQQFTRRFEEAARLEDSLTGGSGEEESAVRGAREPSLVTFDLLSAGPEALAPQRGPPLCDLLSGTHDDEQRACEAGGVESSPANGGDQAQPGGGGQAERGRERTPGAEMSRDGGCSTSVPGEPLAGGMAAEPRSPDRHPAHERQRHPELAVETSPETNANVVFNADIAQSDLCRSNRPPEAPLSPETVPSAAAEISAENGEFEGTAGSCGDGENSSSVVAIERPVVPGECRQRDSEENEISSKLLNEPFAGDPPQQRPPVPGGGAVADRLPFSCGPEREAPCDGKEVASSALVVETLAAETVGVEEPKVQERREERDASAVADDAARRTHGATDTLGSDANLEAFLSSLETRSESPPASPTFTPQEDEQDASTVAEDGATDTLVNDADLEAFLSSLEAGSESPPASPTVTLKEDRVTEEKEVEDSKSDTSGDSASPLRVGGAGSPAMASLKSRHTPPPPPHNGDGGAAAAGPPPGGARPKQPLHLTLPLPRPASDLVGAARDEPDGREPHEPRAALAPASENHVAATAATMEDGETTQEEEDEEEEEERRVWSPGGGASGAQALGEQPGSHRGKEGPGTSAPHWVPDAEAPSCMLCEARFTFTRRRHHCRACGKVFCAPCCSMKSRLRYMENKEARVCVRCYNYITKAEAAAKSVASAPSPPPPPTPPTPTAPPSGSPNPNNPAEYCSTLPPLQQARAAGTLASPPPTVMVPVSALKHPGQDGSQREPRRVWFADGILPNGEMADATLMSGTPGTPVPGASPPPTPPPAAAAAAAAVAQDPGLPVSLNEEALLPSSVTPVVPAAPEVPAASLGPPVPPGSGSRFLPAPTGSPVGKGVNLIPDDDEGLPPILISSGVKGDYSVEERPSPGLLVAVLEEAESRGGGGSDAAPVVFVLNANLLVSLRIINYVNRRCWVFATRGMHAVGQAEVVVLLQCLPDEKSVPKDIFHSLLHVYTDAYKGKPVGHLGHSFLGRGFLGSREHGGFLFVSPAMQALPACELPPRPLLFALLIQKWEAPWAKVFPIRLMLRLGAEFRFYPCPLFSVRFRKPLFGETGHTIMNLLADFRNYQYSLPTVPGLVVSMEMGHTWIDIPSNRYNQMAKVLNSANEHVLAFGAVFNAAADSHLVCVQNDDGNYQTQAINIHATPRKVTGASFVVFNGALKSSSGFLAKSSIVEDGLMVQITAEGMEALRSALREMRDHTLVCGRADGEAPREHVHVRWAADDAAFNRGVTSPIDGHSMEGVPSVKIFQGSEFKGSGKIIRWTEVFFLQKEEEEGGEGSSREGGTATFDPADHSRVAEAVARAFCVALASRLKELREDGLTQLGLRLTLHSEQVGYQAGGNGQPLPAQYMNELDCALIPIMHGGGGGGGPGDGAVRMELIFYIMENVS